MLYDLVSLVVVVVMIGVAYVMGYKAGRKEK